MRTIWVLTALVGCKKGGDPDLVLTEGNNYSYTGELAIDTVEIAAQSEATVDWSGVTTDIRGRELDPASIQQLAILGVNSPLEESIRLIEVNELDQSQDAYLYDNAGGTSAQLSDFNIIGAYLQLQDLEEDPEKTWLISMLNVSDGRTDLLMSAVVVPTEDSSNTTIALTDTSATLDVEIDLHSPAPLATEADIGPYSLDWTEVTTDVFGHPFQPLLGDELIVGRYATEDIAEIEAGFLQLDTNAAELYRANVAGVTAVDLEEAVSDSGAAFPGFTTDGTWLVGVICTTCITPVPLLLSIVEVE